MFDIEHKVYLSLVQEPLMWHLITSIHQVPNDKKLRLGVMDREGLHPLVSPCTRVGESWIDSESNRRIDVRPTHWEEWE